MLREDRMYIRSRDPGNTRESHHFLHTQDQYKSCRPVQVLLSCWLAIIKTGKCFLYGLGRQLIYLPIFAVPKYRWVLSKLGERHSDLTFEHHATCAFWHPRLSTVAPATLGMCYIARQQATQSCASCLVPPQPNSCDKKFDSIDIWKQAVWFFMQHRPVYRR